MSSNVSEVSFPGLGIGPFDLNNTSFTIFGREVKWYGIIVCIGIIAAFLYFMYRAKQAGIKSDTVVDMTLVTVPIGIIGARLYFVIFYGVPFKEILEVWNGGLAIYGGIIFGAISVIVMCRIKKVKFFAFADMIAPGVMLGQLIGRWGNFMNGEAYGAETTSFIRMGLCNWHTGYQYVEVHPTFLYESLWNLIGFALINIFYKKRKFNGEAFLWYVAWYGLGRTFIELLRQDSLYMGGIRVSSLLGAICFAVCMPIIIILHIRHAKLAKAGFCEKDEIMDLTALLGITKSKKAEPATEKAPEAATEEMPEKANEAAEAENGGAADETEDGDGKDN